MIESLWFRPDNIPSTLWCHLICIIPIILLILNWAYTLSLICFTYDRWSLQVRIINRWIILCVPDCRWSFRGVCAPLFYYLRLWCRLLQTSLFDHSLFLVSLIRMILVISTYNINIIVFLISHRHHPFFLCLLLLIFQ